MRLIGRSASALPTAVRDQAVSGQQSAVSRTGRPHRAWALSAAVLGAWASVAFAASSTGESATRPADGDRPAAKRGEDAKSDGTVKKDARQRREGWRERGERPDQPGAEEDRPRGLRYMGGAGEGGEDRDVLTADERERLKEFAKQNFPELAERLKTGRIPPRVAWPLLRLMRMKDNDPELADKLIKEHQIEMKLMDARREYRDAPSETAKESVRKKIRQYLEQRFDVRQARLELEIRDLQKRIERAKDRLAKQQRNKTQLVDSELEHMTDAIEDGSDRGEDRAALPEVPGGGPPGLGPRSERPDRTQPKER